MKLIPFIKPIFLALSCGLWFLPTVALSHVIKETTAEVRESPTMVITSRDSLQQAGRDSLQQATPVRRSPMSHRRGFSQQADKESPNSLVQRQRQFNDRLRKNTQNAPWKRVIYRQVDLDSANNAVLYYPPRPSATEQNLFTILFKKINKGELDAYEYTGGVEVFDEHTAIKFGEFLDRFGIYATQGEGEEPSSLRVADADIPSDLVKSYYIKEEYYFDPINSSTSKRVVAICPIFYDSLGGEQLHFPLFWVKYDDIRPFINSEMVMLSDLNNSESLTLDGFFRLGLYKGDIYKTLNLRGLTLAQYCPTPDSLQSERQRIEKELQSFEASLWSRAAKETETTEKEANLTSSNSTEEVQGEAKTARARRSEANKQHSVEKRKSAKMPKQKKRSSTKKTASKGRSARSRF